MQCGSCLEEIPSDSIFCPECGARQEMSRAGGLPGVGGVGLGGQDVSGGRNFGVVSGEAVINQNMQGMPNQGMPPGMMPDIMGQIAPNLPGMPPANTGLPPLNQGMPPSNVTPLPGQAPPNIGGSRGDMPPAVKGPSLASGVGPNAQLGDLGNQIGGTAVSSNPSLSPTDAMVNRIAEAERAVKNERRSQWLQMNQQSAANVLSSIGGELPAHLKGQDENSAAEFLASAIGSGKDESGNDALFKRMAEVAVRRVARKRGVAVDAPQTRTENGVLIVNVTYIDDGRVLDTPEDLSAAFEHAISTEVALKGLDAVVDINLFRSKDGTVDKIGSDGSAPAVEESDEEMFACEVCDGLVKESDNECPHCGAIFEEEEEEPVSAPPARGGPPGPSRGGPPGPSRAGGPPGPKRGGPPSGGPGGPPKSGGPPGPKRGGPPSGSRGGPPKSGGPPGPKRGGPPSGGPGGPPKSGGPPGPKRGGPPSGGPGGPPKSGGPPGPKRGGPPGPKRGPPK